MELILIHLSFKLMEANGENIGNQRNHIQPSEEKIFRAKSNKITAGFA
jgi:hypothetical protein